MYSCYDANGIYFEITSNYIFYFVIKNGIGTDF